MEPEARFRGTALRCAQESLRKLLGVAGTIFGHHLLTSTGGGRIKPLILWSCVVSLGGGGVRGERMIVRGQHELKLALQKQCEASQKETYGGLDV